MLAHGFLHRVLGITLPPSDANVFFIAIFGSSTDVKKERGSVGRGRAVGYRRAIS